LQTLTADLSAFFEHFHDHGRLVRHSPAHIYHSGDSKIPGIEGRDYPAYSRIPETGFSCTEHRQDDRMYADRRTRCQVRRRRVSQQVFPVGYLTACKCIQRVLHT
jgi:hypothetical protein